MITIQVLLALILFEIGKSINWRGFYFKAYDHFTYPEKEANPKGIQYGDFPTGRIIHVRQYGTYKTPWMGLPKRLFVKKVIK